MRAEYTPKGIDHQFDVYHIVNSFRRKLNEICKRKKYKSVVPWVRRILNHVWYSSRNCDGNPDKLVELFSSIAYHISGKHKWKGNKFINMCSHAPLGREEQKSKLWLKGQSLLAVKDILFDPRMLQDIRQLSLFCHTGNLESYHSKLLVYCPKRQEFDCPCMLGRTRLAVIDHNVNVGRKQAVIKNKGSSVCGEGRYWQTWKKSTTQ